MMKQMPEMAMTQNVYCVNNFGHTLFNQMNVTFNGVLMTEQSNAYHQKAYLETLHCRITIVKKEKLPWLLKDGSMN